MKKITESLTKCFLFWTSEKTYSHKVYDNTVKKLNTFFHYRYLTLLFSHQAGTATSISIFSQP